MFVDNLQSVLEYAANRNVLVAVEPRPGMLIDNIGRFERLFHVVESEQLRLTLDIGQMFCLSEVPIANFIERWQDQLINVHVCDARVGQDEHLIFGEGQIYFPPIIESLLGIGYSHAIHVELDLQSHDAVRAVRESFAVLNPIIEDVRETLEQA